MSSLREGRSVRTVVLPSFAIASLRLDRKNMAPHKTQTAGQGRLENGQIYSSHSMCRFISGFSYTHLARGLGLVHEPLRQIWHYNALVVAYLKNW